jgi:hypothetical protein
MFFTYLLLLHSVNIPKPVPCTTCNPFELDVGQHNNNNDKK